MIESLYITQDNKILEANETTPLHWIHVQNPTPEEILALSKEYEFPQDYLSAVLDNQEISRYEAPIQNELIKPILLLLQYPKEITSPSGFVQFEALPFSIILTPKLLITSCKGDFNFRHELEKGRAFNSSLPITEKIAIQLAWSFSDLFNHHIKGIKYETDRLESELHLATENKQLFELMDMQKSLVYFDSALEQNLSVLQRTYESKIIMTTKEGSIALYDIIIETKQALASGKIQAELLGQLGSMFSAIVGNNMNIVMKLLTVITIILTIPTLVGGIYGMNVRLPFSNDTNAFWFLMFVILISSIATIWILKKKKFF